MFAVSAYIYATRNFAHDTSIVWLVFCGPDCNMIAKQGGGPDGRPSWAGSGPRAGGCPPLHYTIQLQVIIREQHNVPPKTQENTQTPSDPLLPGLYSISPVVDAQERTGLLRLLQCRGPG